MRIVPTLGSDHGPAIRGAELPRLHRLRIFLDDPDAGLQLGERGGHGLSGRVLPVPSVPDLDQVSAQGFPGTPGRTVRFDVDMRLLRC